MRTIVIIFGDNDYHATFRHLLASLRWIINYRGLETMTRKKVEELIREGIRFHYLAFQHDEVHRDLERSVAYLSGIQILFDAEAERSIQTEDHDHGAWYLELQSGTIDSF